jgi:hypothetical protein
MEINFNALPGVLPCFNFLTQSQGTTFNDEHFFCIQLNLPERKSRFVKAASAEIILSDDLHTVDHSFDFLRIENREREQKFSQCVSHELIYFPTVRYIPSPIPSVIHHNLNDR